MAMAATTERMRTSHRVPSIASPLSSLSSLLSTPLKMINLLPVHIATPASYYNYMESSEHDQHHHKKKRYA
jgi:hypothetical protein